MRLRNIIISGSIALSLTFSAVRAAPPDNPASQPSTKLSGKILATVNGEPIYESQVLAGLPDDAFEAQLKALKKAKLNRLIAQTIGAQFLNNHEITVPDEELETALSDFEEMLTIPGGCACHGGGYESLDQFVKLNAFTMEGFRTYLTIETGLRLYKDRLVKEMQTPEAIEKAVDKHREQIEADFVKGATISFDFFQDPNYFRNPKPVKAKKEKLANEAWERLQQGQAFDQVAREMSDDSATASKGGELGCVRSDWLGSEVQEAWSTQEPGTYSKPIKTNWGYCIVTRKNLTDEDIRSLLIEQAAELVQEEIDQELKVFMDAAKIEYMTAY